jgi:hypothetical protein
VLAKFLFPPEYVSVPAFGKVIVVVLVVVVVSRVVVLVVVVVIGWVGEGVVVEVVKVSDPVGVSVGV